ncbi:MAG: ABC transporter permease subunit [Acidimicrobiales bacterium]|nr:ABC transporter permease subunit [Acidimicrobiales bacterium]
MSSVLAQSGVQADDIGIFDSTILDQWEVPFGDWIDQMVDWIDANLSWLLDAIRWPFAFLLDNFVNEFLIEIPWVWVVLATVVIGALVRTPKVGVAAGLAMAFCGLLGTSYWIETVRTVGMVLVAVILCAIVGIPLGIICGRIDSVWNVVRPILDAMQVVHAFVYMLPVIFFWSIGVVPGTMVTMVFALPPLIRLTNLGIRQVPEDVVEASRAYGATELRVLVDVQLPLARPALMTGLNQTLLMSIAMIGIAAIMGAGGLGRLVYRAVQNLDIAASASSGLALFLVAVVLDRLSQPEVSDGGNMFGRIHQAWAHRRDPEALLKGVDDASLKPKDDSEDENYAPSTGRERIGMLLSGVGGAMAILSLFMTWSRDAGHLSGHARFADNDLAGQAFGGFAASGGSSVGWFTFGIGIFLLMGSVVFLRRPGSGSRWFSPDGATLASIAMLFTVLTHVVARSAPETVSYSHGIGAYLALAAAAVATVGSVMALLVAPYSPLRPLSRRVGWARVLSGSVAVFIIGVGAFSGWSFDERLSGQLSPEQQVEVERLQQQARDDPSKAPLNTLEVGRIYNKARLSSKIVVDGMTDGWRVIGESAVDSAGSPLTGAGLGRLALVTGLIGSVFMLPAAGVFGHGDRWKWRWSALTGGLGLGVMLIGMSWAASTMRVSPPLYVSGAGVLLTMCGGFFLFASSRPLLVEFHRKKVYEDDPSTAAEAVLAAK